MTTPNEQNYRPLGPDEVIQEGDEYKHLTSTVWGLCIASTGETPKEWPEFVFRRPIPAETIVKEKALDGSEPIAIGGTSYCETCGNQVFPDDCCTCPSPSAPFGKCSSCGQPLNSNQVCDLCFPAEPEPKGEEKDFRVPLWEAINEYVVSCAGDPSKHVYGNTARQKSVVVVENIIRAQLATVTEERDRFKAALRKISCMYCGKQWSIDDPTSNKLLADHILSCDKSPLVSLLMNLTVGLTPLMETLNRVAGDPETGWHGSIRIDDKFIEALTLAREAVKGNEVPALVELRAQLAESEKKRAEAEEKLQVAVGLACIEDYPKDIANDLLVARKEIVELRARAEKAERERDEAIHAGQQQVCDLSGQLAEVIEEREQILGEKKIAVDNGLLLADERDRLQAELAKCREQKSVFSKFKINDRDGFFPVDYIRSNFESACTNTPKLNCVFLERDSSGEFADDFTQAAFVAFALGMRCVQRIDPAKAALEGGE